MGHETHGLITATARLIPKLEFSLNLVIRIEAPAPFRPGAPTTSGLAEKKGESSFAKVRPGRPRWIPAPGSRSATIQFGQAIRRGRCRHDGPVLTVRRSKRSHSRAKAAHKTKKANPPRRRPGVPGHPSCGAIAEHQPTLQIVILTAKSPYSMPLTPLPPFSDYPSLPDDPQRRFLASKFSAHSKNLLSLASNFRLGLQSVG